MQLALDLALVAVIVLALVAGWRQGALSSVVSAIGVIAGLVVGLALAPVAMGLAQTQSLRVLLLVAVVVLLVGIGNAVGSAAGSQLRDGVRRASARTLDSLAGALFQALAMALVMWFISIPLAASVPGKAGDAVRESRVLATIDVASPDVLAQLPARIAALLDETGLPPLVSPFATPRGSHVDAPDSAAVDPAMVERVRPAVVQVMGDSGSCQRRLMGTGFVIEEDYVLTNAHVVAGTDVVALDTVLGIKEASVVFYDPDVDIAVLHADQLGIAPIAWAQVPLATADDAVVMGYPLSGPFEAAPARVRGKLNISGPDIYAKGRVSREAYTIRGVIRQGNSGGPLLNTQGDVVGMIFGASLDSTDTGYALTADQVKARVGDIRRLEGNVDTQACVGAA
ncbi:MarP family serine protease [Corynebacterium sp. CNCTC7651]|uniref:MarP family serine protease n=1 Tax=Corynebacterium sp. CNCTC7651 TaxID=2815361 RepID=UPI001F2C60FB|nr:MarP family serine protease [Corynebacterium sp. CNCTC7651]UIZ92319.1 MarP family serine protease [Corynebacterium sp. CNCTC7651]